MSEPEQKFNDMIAAANIYLEKFHECTEYFRDNEVSDSQKMQFIAYCNDMSQEHREALRIIANYPKSKTDDENE